MNKWLPADPARLNRWVYAPRTVSKPADYASPLERSRGSVAGELRMGLGLVAVLLFFLFGFHLVAAFWPQLEALVKALGGVA